MNGVLDKIIVINNSDGRFITKLTKFNKLLSSMCITAISFIYLADAIKTYNKKYNKETKEQEELKGD